MLEAGKKEKTTIGLGTQDTQYRLRLEIKRNISDDGMWWNKDEDYWYP